MLLTHPAPLPYPNPQKNSRQHKRREAILGVAAELFLDKGFNNVSIDDIVRRSRGSKTTLYKMFRSKEALYEAVLRERSHQTGHAIAPRGFEQSIEDWATQTLPPLRDMALLVLSNGPTAARAGGQLLNQALLEAATGIKACAGYAPRGIGGHDWPLVAAAGLLLLDILQDCGEQAAL